MITDYERVGLELDFKTRLETLTLKEWRSNGRIIWSANARFRFGQITRKQYLKCKRRSRARRRRAQ